MIQMVTKPECPSMMQNKKNYTIITGHQRANTTNSKLFNKPNHNSQQTLVNRPTPKKLTKELQEHTCHKEILSVQINDMQKSMYNTKVCNTEAMALFDSGAMLSCISKQFYDHICQLEPSMVIDTSTGPPIVITSASPEELTNLGRGRLCIKLGP